jgi:hypothetical protein
MTNDITNLATGAPDSGAKDGAAKSTRAAYSDGPRLLADIGATHARFALETAPGVQRNVAVLLCDDYPPISRRSGPRPAVCASATARSRWPTRSAATSSA